VNYRKLASYAGAATVATIAAVVSYAHMRDLAAAAGQSPALAALLPLSVDGLVVVASVALVDGRTRKLSAWLAFFLGVSASIVANVLAARPDLVSRAVSAWPSLSLLLTIEVIARGGKPSTSVIMPSRRPAPAVDRAREPRPLTKPAARKPSAAKRPTTSAQRVAKAAANKPGASVAELARHLGLSESTVRRNMPETATFPEIAKPHDNGKVNGVLVGQSN